jgi:ParB-like chromosome segregation protein Spo0J
MTIPESKEVEASPSELGTSLRGLRLCERNAERQMALSLSNEGQLTPLQAWREGGNLELFDGMKRLRAAQTLSWTKLRVEVHALDAIGAKVRLLLCNRAAGVSDMEEAWVVRALYREERLDQPQIAQLLGRHKSWVCRRLTLAEGLSEELEANVRLGVVCARAAVELARLPRGNQTAAAQIVMRRGLTTRQTATLVDALLSSPKDQWPALLEKGPPLAAPVGPKGGARRRTPGEQIAAEAWAMKRLSVRLHARLLERSLESLGVEASALVREPLGELRDGLGALMKTLEIRLKPQGASDAAAR